MAIFDTRQPVKGNIPNQKSPSSVYQVDQTCKAAEDAVKEAIQSLGRAYYEANQNNTESEFYSEISAVKECMEKEKLWRLYRLSFEGKTQCDSCGAIITADSAFCNKCGAGIKPRDFSVIGISQLQSNHNISPGICPSCGSPLVAGAMFCEKCGHKVN